MPRRASINKRKGRMSKKHNRHARKATKKGLEKENMPIFIITLESPRAARKKK
jgi:hypothetical protein